MKTKSNFNPKIAKKFCQLVSEGRYTVKTICEAVGVPHPTIYSWFQKYPEFKRDYDDAVEMKYRTIGDIAEKSLLKKIEGYTYEEKSVTTGKYETETITTKHVPPSDSAIIFALKNLINDRFKDKPGEKQAEEITDINDLKSEIRKLVQDNGFHE